MRDGVAETRDERIWDLREEGAIVDMLLVSFEESGDSEFGCTEGRTPFKVVR